MPFMLNETMQSAGENGSRAIVEKDVHATNRCSINVSNSKA